MKKFLSALLSLVLAFNTVTPAFAAPGLPATYDALMCVTGRVAVAFSNGVNTDPVTASTQARVLRQTITQKHTSVAFADGGVVMYHQDNGWRDFLEVYVQKVDEAANVGELDWEAASHVFFKGLAGASISGPLAVVLRGAASILLSQTALSSTSAKVTASVESDLSKAKIVLARGDSLLMVAHSQGTLFSNEVMRRLYAELPAAEVNAKVSLLGAGGAAASIISLDGVGSAQHHVTSFTDLVIGLLATVSVLTGLPAPASPNTIGLTSTPDGALDWVVQHSFKGVYSNESLPTGQKLFGLIATQIAHLSTSLVDSDANTTALEFSIPMWVSTSVAGDFDEGPIINAPTTGLFATHGAAWLRYEGDPFGFRYEGRVRCSVANALSTSATPIQTALIIDSDTPMSPVPGASVTLNGVEYSLDGPGVAVTSPAAGTTMLSVNLGSATKGSADLAFNLKNFGHP